MCKFKLTTRGVSVAVSIAALTGLAMFNPPTSLAQQPPGCLSGGSASVITVSPTTAHIGDTVNITQLGFAQSGVTCELTNGQSFIMYPDGVVPTYSNGHMYETNFFTDSTHLVLTCLPSPSSPQA